MKYYLLLSGLFAVGVASAQTKIKDGTVTGTSAQPQANAVLELESNNKGLLLPRVSLTGTSNFAPLTSHVAGMTVYNTATAGAGATAVSPGFYYNDGTKWVRIGTNFTETVTTLIDNDSSFTYINESGDSVTFALPPAENIYVTDGTLTDNRRVTLDGKSLTFLGNFQQTSWSLYSGIIQEGLASSPYNEASIMLIAPDKNGNGAKNYLSLQAFSEGDAQIYATTEATSLIIGTHATLASAPISFATSEGGGALATEKATITGTGEMGIATNNPSEKLDIGEGNVRIRDIYTNTGNIAADKVMVADIDGVLKTVEPSTLAVEPWQIQSTTDKASANTQNIYQQGSVAIGAASIPPIVAGGTTVTPKLYIAGDVSSTGKFWTTSSVYADYVFEQYYDGFSKIYNGYQFKSLPEVAAFIKAHKHLPGVTPISEIAIGESGYTVDLTQLSMQQLEKLEELYLHVIEQQARLDRQSEQITLQQNLMDCQQKELNQLKERLAKLEQLLNK